MEGGCAQSWHQPGSRGGSQIAIASPDSVNLFLVTGFTF
jgi:hypothetical protein